MQLEFDILRENRIIILSLQPEPFKKIMDGIKKHEFRRKFLNKPVNAFIYVSSPIKEIKGYIEFGKPIIDKVEEIGRIAEEEGSGTIVGMSKYMEGLDQGYAVPILSFREIEPIPLSELRSKYNFTAPQSYINIETIPLLKIDLIKRLNV